MCRTIGDVLEHRAREILEVLGYTVLETNAPAEALRAAGAHPGAIHLLLTDVVMPR